MPKPVVSISLALRTGRCLPSGLCLFSLGLINPNCNFFCQSNSEMQGSGNHRLAAVLIKEHQGPGEIT